MKHGNHLVNYRAMDAILPQVGLLLGQWDEVLHGVRIKVTDMQISQLFLQIPCLLVLCCK